MSDDPDGTTNTHSQDVTRDSGFNEGLAQAERGSDELPNQPSDQPLDLPLNLPLGKPMNLARDQTLNTPADESSVPAKAGPSTRDASANVVTLTPEDQE